MPHAPTAEQLRAALDVLGGAEASFREAAQAHMLRHGGDADSVASAHHRLEEARYQVRALVLTLPGVAPGRGAGMVPFDFWD